MCYVLVAMCYVLCAMCYVLCAMCYVLCAMLQETAQSGGKLSDPGLLQKSSKATDATIFSWIGLLATYTTQIKPEIGQIRGVLG